MHVPPHPGLAGGVPFAPGGSRGTGAATCRALAANGVKVVVNGRDKTAVDGLVDAITADGGQALAAPGDATDAAVVRRIREDVERVLGPVDILAPFVGGQGKPVPTHQLGADRWRATLES